LLVFVQALPLFLALSTAVWLIGIAIYKAYVDPDLSKHSQFLVRRARLPHVRATPRPFT
jgi:hypothetical protein